MYIIVGNATGGMAGDSDATPTPNNDATPAPSGTLSGRGFTTLWSAGDLSPSLLWNRTYSTDNSGGDSLFPYDALPWATVFAPHDHW